MGYRSICFLDLESYSSVDLRTAGLHRYTEADDFEILLVQYAYNDDPVEVLDIAGGGEKDLTNWRRLRDDLRNPQILKVAHNAAFERACLQRATGEYQPPEQWCDTMVLALYNGLPASLEDAGAALGIEQQKLAASGKALIPYFCKPCRPTKANGGRTRNLPEHAPEKWEKFKEYGARDVEAERAIYRRLAGTNVTAAEQRVRCLDARIVERGVLIDRELAEAAVRMDEAYTEKALTEMQRLTGLPNPGSPAQLKAWLAGCGIQTDTLDKKAVADLLETVHDRTVRRVLTLRQHTGKTSTAKYQAMLDAVCADGRVRGLLQYYGAARTGRWAGRLVQIQNLPQNHLENIGQVRELVKAGDLEALELLYDNVPDVLSQLIRTAFIAPEGQTLLVADYHAIEAVCIAFLAGEEWRLDVFRTHGRIYEASYAQAFGVPMDSVTKGSPERQKGKIMELALGYGGGVAALKAFGADKLGLSDDELQELVDAWRAASPRIPAFWRSVERTAKEALTYPGRVYWCMEYQIAFLAGRTGLCCILPGGRSLHYWGARLEDGQIVFMAQNQTTRKWEKTETWGGKLVENIVQAYARNVLAEALLRLDAAGYGIVFHVHDEIVSEAPEGSSVEDYCRIMATPPIWAPGLGEILRADGYATPFYMKD